MLVSEGAVEEVPAFGFIFLGMGSGGLLMLGLKLFVVLPGANRDRRYRKMRDSMIIRLNCRWL